MGIFNYCCALKTANGKKCKLYNEQGQDHTSGTIYAVDKTFQRKYPLDYSGYGYADNTNDETIFDLGHKEFFQCWNVTLMDKKALFIFSNCACSVSIEVNTFEDVEPLTFEEKRIQEVQYFEEKLLVALKKRKSINELIKSIRARLKRINS